jgi:hypothetical protein
MSNLILQEGLLGLYITLQNGPLDKVKKISLNESLFFSIIYLATQLTK